MKKKSLVISLLACCLTFGLYTNCGEGFVASGDYFSGGTDNKGSEIAKSCEDIKKISFNSNNFHSFLVTNCSACHSAGEAQGLFASDNRDIAFSTFNSFGWSRIMENAVDDNHPGPNNGPGLQAAVDKLDAAWDRTLSSYKECLKNNSESNLGTYDLLTDEQKLNVTDAWSTVTWSLNTNFYESNSDHTINLRFKVDVQNYYGEGVRPELPVGYLFKSPRFSFEGAEDKFYVESVTLVSEGVPVEDFEIWQQLNVLIEKQNAVNGKVPDSVIIGDDQRKFALISENISDIQSLALVFNKIVDNTGGINSEIIPEEPNKVEPQPTKPVINERVTFTDLVGDGDLGVFKQSCFECHGNGQTRKGLALDVFAQARDSAGRIGARINDGAEPMPPLSHGGLMSLKDIAIVEKWIELGSPEN